MAIIYEVTAPNCKDGIIQVYDSGLFFEWRVIEGEKITKDTGTETEGYAFDRLGMKGRLYNKAEIALRDALLYLAPVGDMKYRAGSCENG